MKDRSEPTTRTLPSAEARRRWGKLLREVSCKEARVVVERGGKPVAALVSIDDLARITATEPDATVATSWVLPQEVIDAANAANLARAEETRALLAPPSPELIERRKAIAARVKANLPYRNIAPLTTADLIHEARAEEEAAYGRPR